jgi:phosphatidylserine/phosphatidylglycerophosphate/cardiolipin synthase-like enzyme
MARLRSLLAVLLCLVACGDPSLAEQSASATDACALSELGEAVLQAALSAEPSRNTVSPERMLSFDNRVGDALLTGPAIFPAVAEAIVEAEHEVLIAMFVFDRSDAYDEIAAALSRLAERRAAAGAEVPVVVRIVVDAQKAFFNTGDEVVARAYGGIAALNLDPDYVQVLVATYEHFALGNLHTKTVIVDGRTALLGGANVQSQHDYADPWMDSFHRIDGPAAQTLLADFDHAWAKARKWHCRLQEVGDDDASDEALCQRWPDAPPMWHPAAVLDPDFDSAGACAPSFALNRTAWGGFNNDVDNPMAQGLLAAIAHARVRVRIHTPNLNDDAVRDALVAAVAGGVEVQIVLSLGFNATAMAYFGGSNATVAERLRARVLEHAPEQAHLLDIRWYSRDGVEPVDGNVPGASHLKYLSIDGQLAVVGSTNMDTIALNHSRETNLAIDTPAVTERWDAQIFEPSFGRAIPAQP